MEKTTLFQQQGQGEYIQLELSWAYSQQKCQCESYVLALLHHLQIQHLMISINKKLSLTEIILSVDYLKNWANKTPSCKLKSLKLT